MVGGLLHNTAQPHIRGHKDENMIEIFQSLLLDLCSCVTTTAQQQQQPGSLETFYLPCCDVLFLVPYRIALQSKADNKICDDFRISHALAS